MEKWIIMVTMYLIIQLFFIVKIMLDIIIIKDSLIKSSHFATDRHDFIRSRVEYSQLIQCSYLNDTLGRVKVIEKHIVGEDYTDWSTEELIEHVKNLEKEDI